jgi:hypothetical protein
MLVEVVEDTILQVEHDLLVDLAAVEQGVLQEFQDLQEQ